MFRKFNGGKIISLCVFSNALRIEAAEMNVSGLRERDP